MKGRYHWCLILTMAICLAGETKAQQPEGLSKGSLQEQFDFMVNESSRYQTFKVIQQAWLNNFWTHVQDTLMSHQVLLKQNETTINTQEKDIQEINAGLEKLQQQTDALNKEKNSLVFLGIGMDKAVYHVLVWTIIGCLLAGMLFFMGRFRYANGITREARADNRELQESVAQLRKRMLEKEQDLRRQLQDEINKRLEE